MEFLHALQFVANSGGEEVTGIAALGLDPLAILAQALTFLVLFFILKKFALNGIVATLEKRRKTIDDGVRLGLEMEAEKTKLDEQVDKVLHKARDEADKIIAQAHEESGTIIKDAEDKAIVKVDGMIEDARNKIEDEVKQAQKNLQQETLRLVADATGIIIKEKLNASKDAKLIEEALEEAQL